MKVTRTSNYKNEKKYNETYKNYCTNIRVELSCISCILQLSVGCCRYNNSMLTRYLKKSCKK